MPCATQNEINEEDAKMLHANGVTSEPVPDVVGMFANEGVFVFCHDAT